MNINRQEPRLVRHYGYVESSRDYDTSLERTPKEDMTLPLPTTSNHRQNYFKPMGMRNNYLCGQPVVSSSQPTVHHTPPPPISSKDRIINTSPAQSEAEDLVAMGTNWSPAAITTMRGVGIRHSGVHGLYGSPTMGYGLSQSLPSHAFGSTIPRKPGTKMGNVGIGLSKAREAEPKYTDPLIGAPFGLQQRLTEISNLEMETIRWEKSRKMKKKSYKDA